MKADDAREFSESIAQIGEGWWRQIAWAYRQGVHKALGMSRRDWAENYHGYLKMPAIERQEAVAELTAEGYSQREVADTLGVEHRTVGRDVTAANAPPEAELTAPDGGVTGANAPPDLTDFVAAQAEKWQGDKGVLVAGDEDDWPTPPHIIEAAVATLGGIDLDPCASSANRVPATVRPPCASLSAVGSHADARLPGPESHPQPRRATFGPWVV